MLPQTNHIKRLHELDETERKLVIEKALTLERAFGSGDVNQIYKAEQYYKLSQLQKNAPIQRSSDNPLKALMLDPLDVAHSQGYYHKRSALSFESLRAMARTPVAAAVLKTRKNQAADHAKPQSDKYSTGFVIEKIGIEKDDDLSDNDKRYRDQLIEFVLKCGDKPAEYKWDRFETFIRKTVDDSLTLDQATAEVVPYRNLEPYAFAAVDGATMRIADSYDNVTGVEDSRKVNGEYPSYVQLWQGTPIREFYPWEMMFGIRNPNTNILMNGYGRSEMEDLIGIVTAMLNADRYNSGFFRHGAAPKGMLMVKKAGMALDGDRLTEFRRNWNSMIAGAGNAHKLPILDAEQFEWINFQQNNKDMEFYKYLEYLIKIFCAMYTISPEEIGFPLEGTGGSKLGGGDSGKDEKDYSHDKGLLPLLTHIQNWINEWVIGPKTNHKWRFRFAGLKIESAKEEEERLTKAVTLYMTPDEIRREKGLKPLPGGVGKLPLNPIIAQQVMMKAQNEQAQQQQQQEQQQQDGEKDDEQFNNTNPFLDDEKNPFKKAFEDFVLTDMVKQD